MKKIPSLASPAHAASKQFTRKSPVLPIWLHALAVVLMFPLLFSTNLPAQKLLQGPRLTVQAQAEFEKQVSAIKTEKASRTPAQLKLDSQFVYAIHERKQGVAVKDAPQMRAQVEVDGEDKVLLDIKARITPGLLAQIRRLGGDVIHSHPKSHAMRVRLAFGDLETLAAREEVIFIRPAVQAQTNATTGEGSRTHRADYVRDNINILGGTTKADGTGIKVGVISDSDDFLEQAQASEDLPLNVVTLPQQSGRPRSGEGTAMMEIVNEVAPGAQLYFATGFTGEQQMADNIRALAANGCRIIVDDVTYADESPFQDGVIAQAVLEVSGQGVLFFSSAANSGNKNDGSSATWEGDFNALPTIPGTTGSAHNWGGSSFNKVTAVSPNGSDIVKLFWSDPLNASTTNDYDLFVMNDAGAVLRSSTNLQTASQDPYESIQPISGVPAINVGDNIVVARVSGANRFLHVDVGRGRLQFSTSGSTRGHNASNAANAFCVAASPVANSPAPGVFTGGATNPVELFSSDGPRRLFYDASGNAITPGDFSSTGGAVFNKPDITAADGVSNCGFYAPSSNLTPFFGTSAAAPHAAAIAALLLSYNPALTPAQIRSALQDTALDIEAPGYDRDSGHGLIMADRALAAVRIVSDSIPPTVAVTTPVHSSVIKEFTTISGTATDGEGSGIAGSVVNINLFQVSSGKFWNGSSWIAGPASLVVPVTGNTWTYTGTLPDNSNNSLAGQYTLSASTYDNHGNVSPPESGVNNITFAVDTTLPTVGITSPSDGSSITSASYALNGTAEDVSGILHVNCFIRRNADGLYWDGSGWGVPAINLVTNYNASTKLWDRDPPLALPQPGPNLVNGSYNFIAIAVDNAGNHKQSDSVVTVDYHPVYTWTGATLRDSDPYNNSNSWGNPYNWSPYGTPGAGDVVIININDRIDTEFSRTLYGLEMSTGMIHFTNGPGNFGTLTTTNNVNWTGGTLSGIWENQGTATISGPATKLLWDGAVVNNLATMTWLGEGPIVAQANNGNATINNKPGASFRIAAGGTVFSRSYPYHRPVFNNEAGAVLEKQIGADTSTLTIWEYRNAGEIRCGTGTLAFVDGGFDNYDLFLDPGTTLTGAGKLRVNNATQLNTAVNAQCVVELMDGSQIAAPAAANVARFEGILNWWGGVIVGNLTIGPDGVVNLSDAVAGTPVVKVLWDNTTLNNEGTINWLGGGALQARANNGATTCNNLSGGVFNMAADGTLFSRAYPYQTPVFNNESGAIFRKTAGAGTTLINTFAFNHRGGMVCNTGVLAYNTVLNLESTTSWTGGGAYEMQGGTTTLTGTLTLNGPAFTILAGSVYGAEDGTGAFTTTGASTVEWKGGTFVRTLRLTPDSTLNLSDAGVKLLWDGAVLDNQGTITWLGGGPLRAQANNATATVNNLSGSQFHVAADGVVFDRAYPYHTPVFNNAAGAKFTRSVGDGSATIHTYTFNNEGEITAGTGVLEFNTVLNLKHGGTLLGAGQFQMLGGSTNFTGSTSLAGTSFSVMAGTISGADSAVVTSSSGGAWRWLRGNLNGTLEIGTNSEMQIADPAAGPTDKLFLDGAVLNNKGLILWSGGTLQGQANNAISTLNNRAGGRVSVTAEGNLFIRQNPYTMPVFNNDFGAVFEKTAGDPNIASVIDWSFNNNGTLHIGAGKVDLQKAGDSSGVFTADSAAFLRFRGGSHTLRSGTVLSGAGLIQVDGGTVLGDGILNGNTVSPGAFELLSGTLGGTTNYGGSGVFQWTGGTVAGTLTLAAGTHSNLDGESDKILWDGAALNNHGTLIWQGGGPIVAQANYGNAIINNKSGGTFLMAADGTVFARYYPYHRPVFNNEAGALLEKQGTTGSSTLTTWRYNNAGEIRCGSGTLAFTNNLADIDLYLDPGTMLTGNGRLRLQADTRLDAAVHALCPVDLTEGGSLTCQPQSRFEGTLHWTGGTVVGVMTVGPAGVVNLSDAVPGTPVAKLLWDGAVLNNQGTINWLGGGSLQAQANYGTATFNNQSGGVFHAMAGGTVFSRIYPYHTPVFNNSGSFRTGSPLETCTLSNWAFTQTGSGALNIDVAGPALTEFDRFVVTGAAVTLGGSLNVTKLNGYDPDVGTTFAFLSSAGRTGTFSNIYAPDFAVDYTAGGATLRAIAAGLSYDDWVLAANMTGPNSLPNADFDGDGQTNFAEFAFNTDPKSSNAAPQSLSIETIDGQKWLTLNYRRWEDREAAGVIYTPEGSPGLVNWDGIGVVDEDNPGASAIAGSLARRCRVPVGGAKRFLHVKAEN